MAAALRRIRPFCRPIFPRHTAYRTAWKNAELFSCCLRKRHRVSGAVSTSVNRFSFRRITRRSITADFVRPHRTGIFSALVLRHPPRCRSPPHFWNWTFHNFRMQGGPPHGREEKILYQEFPDFCRGYPRGTLRLGVLDSVIGTAYLGTLRKDTLFTATLEIFLPHPVKPPCVELSAAKPPFSQKHFPKTDLGNFWGFGDRIFGKTRNISINFIALFIEI